MRAVLASLVVVAALSACSAGRDGVATRGETGTGGQSETATKPSDALKYSGEPSDSVGVTRDGEPWPFATTREQIEASEWRSRSFYPPEYCWVVHSEYWNTPQYWDIRRWCDKREMQDEFF